MEIPQCRRRLHVVAYVRPTFSFVLISLNPIFFRSLTRLLCHLHQGIALAYGTNLTSFALIAADKQGYVSPLRNVCAYDSFNGTGKVRARAVVVEDIDQFGWQE